MPASSRLAERLALDVVEVYAAAERDLLALIARYLAKGLEEPSWAAEKLAAVQLLERQARLIVDRLKGPGGAEVAKALTLAWNRGAAAAVADAHKAGLGRLEDLAEPLTLPGSLAVERLIEATVDGLESTHLRMVRATEDIYRHVITRASSQVLLGTQTRRQAAQRALDDFAARGITGFVDGAGRGWDLTSYVEMGVRTSTAHAAIDAHVERLQAFGEDLVIVSESPSSCPICAPWEGEVLSLSGDTVGAVADGGSTVVAGSLDDAEADGLFHPNCTHAVSLFIPGVTEQPDDAGLDGYDPQPYEDRQQLRYLERQVRAWKRRDALALDEAAAAKANAKVRAYQARIREHVATSGTKRQPPRERIGAAH